MHTHHPRRRDTWTWSNRNGTFLRVLIAADPDDPPFTLHDHVDVTIQRLVVLSAPGVDQLNHHTVSLQHAATKHGIRLVSADGYHRLLIDRINAANNHTRRTA